MTNPKAEEYLQILLDRCDANPNGMSAGSVQDGVVLIFSETALKKLLEKAALGGGRAVLFVKTTDLTAIN